MPDNRFRLLLFCGARDWGGAEVVLGHLLRGLDDHIEPVLMGVDQGVLAELAMRRPGTPITVVPAISDKRDLRAIWSQRRAMAAARARVIQLNLPTPYADPYSVLVATSILGSAVVALEHLPMAVPSDRFRRLKQATCRRLEAHVAVGTNTAREVEVLYGLPTGSIRPIPNGVPIPPSRPERPRRNGIFHVGALGRLHPQKGLDVLVRAVARMSGVRLTLVGDGPERGNLEHLAEELGCGERVHVTGWQADVGAEVARFHAVAMPSWYEGLPLALLEAMAAGVPVVATPVGSIPQVVESGVTGLLVPPGDADALADALRRLQVDPLLAARLGDEGARRVRSEYDVTHMVRAYKSLYSRLIG
jgi:glycosyltransferase involved in cell wall biosynthesis